MVVRKREADLLEILLICARNVLLLESLARVRISSRAFFSVNCVS